MSAPSDPVVSRLRDNARLSIAIEEAAIGALLDELDRTGKKAPAWLISAMRRRIRTHRVSIIKLRVVMGALGSMSDASLPYIVRGSRKMASSRSSARPRNGR